MLGLVSEQSLYNLMTRDIELEVLPAARAYGVGVIPWSPLQGGLLGGVLKKEQRGPAPRRRAGPSRPLNAHRDQIEAYEKLCAALGEKPANVGARLAAAPGRSDRADHRAPDHGAAGRVAASGRLRLSEDTLSSWTALPGYKPAPEHYAW